MPDTPHNTLLDTWLDRHFPSHEPGGVLGVLCRGHVVMQRSLGLACRSTGRRNSQDTAFRIGSISKPLTACAVQLLAEQGRLDLSAPVREYLPDYPEAGASIRLDHLLTHTAGLVSYTTLPQWQALAAQSITPHELLAQFNQLPLQFTPGERFAYGNSGYAVLGAIIEAVSGLRYGQFMQQQVFSPLRMISSTVAAEEPCPGAVARGYLSDGQSIREEDFYHMSHPWAAGGIVSTWIDILRWLQALMRGELLQPDSVKRACTPYRLNDGTYSSYGYGWSIAQCAGVPSYEHGGVIGGFRSYCLWIPDRELAVVALLNRGWGLSEQALAVQLAEFLLGQLPVELRAVSLDQRLLRPWCGRWHMQAEQYRDVWLEHGHLRSRHVTGREASWLPLSEEEFFDRDFPLARLRLVAGTGGDDQCMQLFVRDRLINSAQRR